MYEVAVVARFRASHALKGEFGPATAVHAHRYRVRVGLRGETLRPDGTLFDLGRLESLVAAALEPLDGRDLDETGLFGGNSTAEAVAHHLFTTLAPSLAGAGLAALSVEVWESPSASARYEGPLQDAG